MFLSRCKTIPSLLNSSALLLLAKSVYIVHIPLSPFLNSPSRYPSLSYKSSRFLIGYISNVFAKLFLICVSFESVLFVCSSFFCSSFIFRHPTIKMIKSNTLMYKAILFIYPIISHLSALIFYKYLYGSYNLLK